MNRVFINSDGIVEVQVVGNQTVESVDAMGAAAYKLLQHQRRAGQPALLLDNLLEIGGVPNDARQRVVDLMRSNEYSKFAMVGSGTMIRLSANLMFQATGKGHRVRYFDSLVKATAWLQAP